MPTIVFASPKGGAGKSTSAVLLAAVEAVKAVRLVRAQERAFRRSIPLAVLLTRTSAAIRPRTLQTIQAEFATQNVRMFKVQIHEREAYRSMFAFGGTLSGLDPKEVTNIRAAVSNARAFAAEVVALLKVPTEAAVEEVA